MIILGKIMPAGADPAASIDELFGGILMQVIIAIMIFLGSALMVYNIIRYGMFVKATNDLENWNRKSGIVMIPLVLLVFFLIGYLIVGFSGMADLIMAGILLGGSIFVYLMLSVMYSIVSRIRENDRLLANRYSEMKDELHSMTSDMLAYFRINLSKDIIEERGGSDLYETDLDQDTYSGLMASRFQYLVDPENEGPSGGTFTREGLLRRYEHGESTVSEIRLIRRKTGEVSFVRLEARLTKKPITEEVIAFLTERACNVEIVQNALMERALLDHYDRIAYLVNGAYHVITSNAGKKTDLVIPDNQDDSYESIYLNYILPALSKDHAPVSGQANPLRLSVIEKELAEHDSYTVDTTFDIEGQLHHKKFEFYVIDRRAKFYLFLLSDSTKAYADLAPELRKLSEDLEQVKAEEQAKEQSLGAIETELLSATDNLFDLLRDAKQHTMNDSVAEDLQRIEFSGAQLVSRIEDLLHPGRESAPSSETPFPVTEGSPAEPVRPLYHILLVDDNELNRELGQALLEDEGITVDLAVDGQDAVNKITGAAPGTFDAILMDIQMPILDGYGAARAIRANPDPSIAGLPIIACTASIEPEDHHLALEAGMNVHAAKPIHPREILSILRELVPGR